MLKTFLVEDEVVIREMIKKMIPWEQYGFELAGEASDGEMALPLILKSKPDLLITDIKMPFMDGLTLCKLVKKELPDIKIVILSGYDDFNYAKQAINIGVEDYLLKPITKNAFIERLEEIHNRYEHEKTQKEYYEKFKLEMQEYERNASRDFFESLVRADFDLEEIYRRAVVIRRKDIQTGRQKYIRRLRIISSVIRLRCFSDIRCSVMRFWSRGSEIR